MLYSVCKVMHFFNRKICVRGKFVFLLQPNYRFENNIKRFKT